MAQTIKVKRGLKVNLPLLLPAEMGFCTDTKEMFVGDGSANVLVGKVMMGTYANRPNAGYEGRFYFVNSGANLGYLYVDDGSTWQRANVVNIGDLQGDLDDLADGTTYKKVKATEITNGQVNKLSDGTNTVTPSEIKSHINDSAKHRTINDTGASSTDLWSAQKIKNELAIAKQGMEYQDSVKDKDLSSPPASPVVGDRYLVKATGAGAWVGKNNNIAEWSGSVWLFTMPNTGTTLFVDDESKQYSWNGTAWVISGAGLQTVTAGNGLTGGGQADTVSLAVGAGNGIIVGTTSVSVKAGKGIKVDSTGVLVDVDNASMGFLNNQLQVINVDGGTF
ncbi:DUF2793 domain-containing protein [Psychrobacillus sp. NPDC093180]|uniref:DUF2793 domain-containing protein n=1 Tax=Psychrobacillus sp. NPDC093180 TaxID=3364489 RepID=UPI0037F12817